ncbi:MAG: hypothetical protein D6732_04780 [Methanobacteriota archaeon]|nr:MAG: hypothetical protein D6732_04780 [Euryarchaeota archaeon]
MAKIKKIGVLSFGKLQGVILLFVGFLAGVIYSFGGLLMDTLVTLGWITSSETPGLSYGTVLAFGALIGMPLIFGACGFVLGMIEAVIYNVLARWFGGIDITFE